MKRVLKLTLDSRDLELGFKPYWYVPNQRLHYSGCCETPLQHYEFPEGVPKTLFLVATSAPHPQANRIDVRNWYTEHAFETAEKLERARDAGDVEAFIRHDDDRDFSVDFGDWLLDAYFAGARYIRIEYQGPFFPHQETYVAIAE